MEKIRSHKGLKVYQLAFETALQIQEISKSFPVGEKYSPTDQVRRCSRAVCANLAEAWRKRQYELLRLNGNTYSYHRPLVFRTIAPSHHRTIVPSPHAFVKFVYI